MYAIIDIRSKHLITRVPSEDMATALCAANPRWQWKPDRRQHRTPTPPKRQRIGRELLLPPGRVRLWIVNKLRGELLGCVGGNDERSALANALLTMAEYVPDLENARLQFTITKVKPDLPPYRGTQPRMPWGKYEGMAFECIPWQYLDRCLTEELNKTDPALYRAIALHLSSIDEWQDRRYDEENARPESNFLRDFTPSESLD